jgi:hypothetical protein
MSTPPNKPDSALNNLTPNSSHMMSIADYKQKQSKTIDLSQHQNIPTFYAVENC